jgi:hypothetical protein
VYSIKTVYLEISGTWTNNPTETSRYTVVETSRFWDEDQGDAWPAVCAVEDILSGRDLGVGIWNGTNYVGTSKDNDMPVKNQAVWAKIWSDSDGVIASLRSGVGSGLLPEGKIIAVPGLYMMNGTTVNAASHADAFVPGMVNLLVVRGTTATRTIVPKPFACKSGGNDVFETNLTNALNGIIATFYLDCWKTYHIMSGENHCGTNVKRNLPADNRWWDE